MGAILNLDDITDIEYFRHLSHVPELVSCRFNRVEILRLATQLWTTPAAKYGFTREQLTEGYKQLIQLGVKRFGLHAFLASNTTSNDYYPQLARMLFELAVELQEETGASDQSD